MSLNDLDNDGIALDGMDPVSYKRGEGLQGLSEFSYELRGITYRFANEANLTEFQEYPAQFIPDFAGSYLRHTQTQDADGRLPGQNNNDDRAYLENTAGLQDVRKPLSGAIDPELKSNPGYEDDSFDNDEVERSNLSDSEA